MSEKIAVDELISHEFKYTDKDKSRDQMHREMEALDNYIVYDPLEDKELK